MPTSKLVASQLVLLVLVLTGNPARSETLNCTPVTTVPVVITAPGVYCLTDDLGTTTVSGSAIEIQTNNVVLDLNGFKLGGLAAGSSTGADGIFADGRRNITIKNGTVRGFYRGIRLLGNANVVEDIRAEQNWSIGIIVTGSLSGNIIRNNLVVSTGGSTLAGQPDVSADGIFVAGDGVRVLNNDVINTFKQGSGVATGIHFGPGDNGLAVNNRITGADKGLFFDVPVSIGKYRDNLTFDVATPFTGGTSVGTND